MYPATNDDDRGPWRYARRACAAAIVTVMCATSCSSPQPPIVETKADAPLNVLLIVADTFRADRVTMRRDGKPLMPYLSALAAESWYFKNCRCQAAWTKPSMVSLFTSLYPDVHRVLFSIEGDLKEINSPRTDVLPKSYETMAEYLKSHGYFTVGIQSNVHLTEHFGFDQGFDSYIMKRHPEFYSDDVSETALEQVGNLASPFFLYVHYMATHGPYDLPPDDPRRPPPPPDLTDQDKDLLNNWHDGYFDRVVFEVGLTAKRKYGNISKIGEDFIRVKYDATAIYLDGEIARLVDRVTKQFPNTVIVITSDHGEELFEHGSVGHGKTLYEELVRIPLIIKAPGAPPRAIDQPVESVDVLPTCASILGLPPKAEWQGQNGAEAQIGPSPDRPIFSSTQMTINNSNRDLEAVVLDNRKLIIDKKHDTKTVFDLSEDPTEIAGTALNEDSRDMALLNALEQHRARNLAHPQRQAEPETTELTPVQMERIKAIGYLQ